MGQNNLGAASFNYAIGLTTILPITSEKTAFTDVQMKMYWKESEKVHTT